MVAKKSSTLLQQQPFEWSKDRLLTGQFLHFSESEKQTPFPSKKKIASFCQIYHPYSYYTILFLNHVFEAISNAEFLTYAPILNQKGPNFNNSRNVSKTTSAVVNFFEILKTLYVPKVPALIQMTTKVNYLHSLLASNALLKSGYKKRETLCWVDSIIA